MGFDASVHAKAVELIKLAIEMTTAAGSGHPTSAASLAHLVTVLLYDRMRWDPADPDNPRGDRLVLSEGHACPVVYAAGADLGMAIGREPAYRRPMTHADALTLRDVHSPIDGHPNPAEGFPFFPAATGSLGQGLSLAAGLALAGRLDGIDRRVYCLIGDGESREGQIWEAVDFILDQRLTSVCPIFNENGYGQAEPVSPQQAPGVTAAKLRAAGWDARIIDGHDPTQINEALEEHSARCRNASAKPLAIVAKTVKGWGFTSVVGSDFHGHAVAKKDLERALAAVDAMGRQVGAAWTPGNLRIPPIPSDSPPAAPRHDPPATLPEALARFGHNGALEKGKFAPRKAFGIALEALGHTLPQVVALDGDVRNSTYSEDFYRDPALRPRFFECRIAEQNMISVAGGLAAGGKIPFAATFGKFLARAEDQIEMGLISRFNLKLVGSHVGVSPSSDGPSQMAIADVTAFRAWTNVRTADGRPFFYILTPADAYAAYALTLAMADHAGPCYLRTLRSDVPLLYQPDTRFQLGGHQVLVEGHDLLIVAAGYMVHEARKAIDTLRAEGVQATLVDAYSLPFDGEALRELVRHHGGRVLTVEDNLGGGLGSAVADALTGEPGDVRLEQMFLRQIPKSARTPDDLLEYLGLSARHIAATAHTLLSFAAHS